MPQTIFQANLTSSNVFIDLANMPATFLQYFFIYVQNQSLYNLYFKLDVSGLPNWSMSNPASGQLGVITAGSSGYFSVSLQRTNPTVDTTDTGSMRIYVYTDAGYTVQVDYADLSVSVTMENTESWSNVTIEPFDVGNSYGWSGGTLANDISVETAGYSYYSNGVAGMVDQIVTLTRNNTILPNKTKVRMTFYAVLRMGNGGGQITYLDELYITINGTTIYDTALNTTTPIITLSAGGTPVWSFSNPWLKFTVDLSAYAGQTVNIVINAKCRSNYVALLLILT